MSNTPTQTTEQKKAAALAHLAILAEIWRSNSNAFLGHNITSDTANPEADFVRLTSQIVNLAQ